MGNGRRRSKGRRSSDYLAIGMKKRVHEEHSQGPIPSILLDKPSKKESHQVYLYSMAARSRRNNRAVNLSRKEATWIIGLEDFRYKSKVGLYVGMLVI